MNWVKINLLKPYFSSKITYNNLRIINLVTAALLAVQAVIILVLSAPSKGNVPINTSYLTTDTLASNASGHQVLSLATRHLFDLKITYLIAAILVVSAIIRFLVSDNYRKQYEKDLRSRRSTARWTDWAISGSLMMVALALLAGVYELSLLLLSVALIVIFSVSNWLSELEGLSQQMKKVVLRLSMLGGLSVWLLIIIYLIGAIFYSTGLPVYVYWLYASLAVLFLLGMVNMYMQNKAVENWKDYLYGERIYIFIGFLAETALAWQVFAGLLKR